ARCRAILKALLVLERERPDTMGALMRTQWETIVLALYLLRGDVEAVAIGGQELRRNIRTMNDRSPKLTMNVDLSWIPTTATPYKIEQIALEVQRLYPNELGAALASRYDYEFRMESTFGLHGIGPMMLHI